MARKTTAQIRFEEYAKGYQSALADVAAKLDEGGVTAAFVWIFDNSNDPAVRAAVAHLAKPPAT